MWQQLPSVEKIRVGLAVFLQAFVAFVAVLLAARGLWTGALVLALGIIFLGLLVYVKIRLSLKNQQTPPDASE